jgi:dUTP pyrophosphatase
MIKQKRYYKVGETVFIKEDRGFGIIKGLNVNPKDGVYKAIVEVTRINEGNAEHTTTKELNLWEIDKDKRQTAKTAKASRTYANKFVKRDILQIPVKYFDNSLPEIRDIEIGDWIDLYSRIDVEIGTLDSAKIPLNVAMELAEGFEAHLLPRSSTFDKWGIILANSEGIIDNSYSGDDDEWAFNAVALRKTSIKKGDKIAQFRIVEKMSKAEFPKVDRLGNPNRGGFGTTGSTVI